MRWTDVTSDPNAPEAVAYRDRQLRAAARLTEPDRRAFVQRLARDKRVIELGCVDHDFDLRTEWWLHGILGEVAAELVGVDYNWEGVEKMNAAGYDAIYADVTKDMSEVHARGTFDLVIAGEIIEHVYSPQSVLEVAKPLLGPGGQLLVTTPNPYAPWRVRAGQRGETWENVDHVTYLFPAGMAEMADRCGMRLVAFGTVNITGRSSSLRASAREWARSKRHRQPLSPPWVSPLDALIMKARRGPMLGEDAAYLLEVA